MNENFQSEIQLKFEFHIPSFMSHILNILEFAKFSLGLHLNMFNSLSSLIGWVIGSMNGRLNMLNVNPFPYVGGS